jgi:hypothetical protein
MTYLPDRTIVRIEDELGKFRPGIVIETNNKDIIIARTESFKKTNHSTQHA